MIGSEQAVILFIWSKIVAYYATYKSISNIDFGDDPLISLLFRFRYVWEKSRLAGGGGWKAPAPFYKFEIKEKSNTVNKVIDILSEMIMFTVVRSGKRCR